MNVLSSANFDVIKNTTVRLLAILFLMAVSSVSFAGEFEAIYNCNSDRNGKAPFQLKFNMAVEGRYKLFSRLRYKSELNGREAQRTLSITYEKDRIRLRSFFYLEGKKLNYPINFDSVPANQTSFIEKLSRKISATEGLNSRRRECRLILSDLTIRHFYEQIFGPRAASNPETKDVILSSEESNQNIKKKQDVSVSGENNNQPKPKTLMSSYAQFCKLYEEALGEEYMWGITGSRRSELKIIGLELDAEYKRHPGWNGNILTECKNSLEAKRKNQIKERQRALKELGETKQKLQLEHAKSLDARFNPTNIFDSRHIACAWKIREIALGYAHCGDYGIIKNNLNKFSHYHLRVQEFPKNNKIERLTVFNLITTSEKWLLYLRPRYSDSAHHNFNIVDRQLPSFVCILSTVEEKKSANKIGNNSYFDIIADYDNAFYDHINEINETNFILPFKNCKIFYRKDK